MRDIYFVKSNYDGHFIAHILKINNIIKFDRKFKNNGELYSVDKFNYHTVLNIVSSELLRRNPTEEVNWIDVYNNQRPYDTFCFGIVEINSEYKDKTSLELIHVNISKMFSDNKDKSIGKAPIDVKIDNKTGCILLEGKIYYDNSSIFWHDLRYGGLNKVFSERQIYCINVVKNNIDRLENYARSFIINDIDGFYSEDLDELQNIMNNKKTNSKDFSPSKILKK